MDFCHNGNTENVTKQFHQACIKGDLEKVTNLLSRKEEINVKQLDQNDTLEKVVKNGNSEIVKLLLKLDVNVNKKDMFFGATPLFWACGKSKLPIAELLLENGAEVDEIVKLSNVTQTFLHNAVFHQNATLVNFLLENGCKTDVRNEKGLTAFEYAMSKKYVDIAKVIAFNNK